MAAITRRRALAGLSLPLVTRRAAARSRAVFGLERWGERWWLRRPDGTLFWSIGINHIDGAPLRSTDGTGAWEALSGNDMRRWLSRQVRPDLLRWGFNTAGWVQAVVTINDQHHRHSRSFTPEE